VAVQLNGCEEDMSDQFLVLFGNQADVWVILCAQCINEGCLGRGFECAPVDCTYSRPIARFFGPYLHTLNIDQISAHI